MKKYLRMLPLALFLCGAALFGAGQFAKSDITPVGKMDCGCGGGNECVTKNRAVGSGAVLTFAGGILAGVGALGTGVQLVRHSRRVRQGA